MSGLGRGIRWAVVVLSMCLLTSCGNAEGKTEAEKAAVAQCTELMEQVSAGHWEAAAGNLNLFGLTGGVPSTEGGILQAMLGREATIGQMHGTVQRTEAGQRVFPLYHPASIIYNRALEEVYRQDLCALRAALRLAK